jgi:hypothetical protein
LPIVEGRKRLGNIPDGNAALKEPPQVLYRRSKVFHLLVQALFVILAHASRTFSGADPLRIIASGSNSANIAVELRESLTPREADYDRH